MFTSVGVFIEMLWIESNGSEKSLRSVGFPIAVLSSGKVWIYSIDALLT